MAVQAARAVPRRRAGSWSGAGIVARDPDWYGLKKDDFRDQGEPPPLLEEAIQRCSNQFPRWDAQVRHANFCCRPIRLRGRVDQLDRETGEVRTSYTTDGEPDDTLLVACGSRLRSKCPTCAWRHQGDSYQVVICGLRGGKGVPESVVEHPRLFVTLTAPSFGPVHARRVRGSKVIACRPRRKGAVCQHGRPSGCGLRHEEGDALVGTPICPDCIDVEAQLIWNARAPELWHRFKTYLPRELARVMGVSQTRLRSFAVVRAAKVAEFQRRGVVHFHAIVRIDGAPPPDDPAAVGPPPPDLTVELLDQAVRAARDATELDSRELRSLGRAEASLRFGDELDVRSIQGGGDISQEKVAAYIAKYLSKGAEGLGLPDERLDASDVPAIKAPEHVCRLVTAAMRLARRPGLRSLRLKDKAHRLGFGGHFLSKSPAYSTTYKQLRATRRRHARRDELGDNGVVLDAWGRPESEGAVLSQGSWGYLGWGYRSHGEGWLVATAARQDREGRQLAKDELADLKAREAAEW